MGYNDEALMNVNLARAFVLLGALLVPAYSFAADMSTDTAGEYLDDAAITAKVKGNFAEDKWVKGRDRSVRTDHGVVDLTGRVDSRDESDRATELASKVKAIIAVQNNLQVRSN